MSKSIRICMSLFFVALFCVTSFGAFSTQYALAADDVKLVGTSSGLVLEPEGEKLFDLTRLNPGDTIKRTINITNSYSKPFTLYLRAERVREEPENGAPDLLKQLILTITYEDEVIYKGPASGKDGESGDMTNNISLGKFNPQDKRQLVAEITLPGPETSNEFQNTKAEIKWIFTAQTSGDSGGGGGKDRDKDKDDEPIEPEPPVEVQEEPIPSGEPEPPSVPSEPEAEPVPPVVEIPDEKIPAGAPDMPETGEGLPYPYYAVGAFAILAGIGLIKKRF